MKELVKNLKGKFWTSKDEMVEEIEAMGYEIADLDDEVIVILDEEDEYLLRVLQAGSTICLI